MAILCFERSGYVYGEKLAKASSLKADADLKLAWSPQEALGLRRQAAKIFEAIGESRSAAECYHMIEEYEKAGRIYMEERLYAQAGDCFHRGGCYALAADAYASGKEFSRCLLVCSEGKLFEVGLWHIESWRSQGLTKTKDMQKLEMDFLEKAALHYHSQNDNKSMMTYVRAFHSIGAMREFLMNTRCLNELICLEVEQGNILGAVTIARIKGDVLLEADILGKGKYFKRASMLILGYVLSYSLWGNGNKGWPLKAVSEMGEPLQKARELAKSESDALYHYVALESKIMLGKNHSLAEMKNNLVASKACANVAGEVLCVRSILDLHFHTNVSKLQLDDDSVVEELISTNLMNGETLFHFWSCWKDLIVKIIWCIQCSESQEIAEEERSYWKFCLDYLGVREEHKVPQSPYSLLHENADWCRNISKNCSRASFASAAERYWCGELMSVGMEVLNKLNVVYQFVIRKPALNFSQSKCLIRIYEAASFLLEADFNKDPFFHERKTLQRYIQTSSKEYFAHVFPNGWLPVTKDMISLRESEASKVLLARNFVINGGLKNRMSNGHLGRIAMVILGSGCLSDEFKLFIGENVESDSACGVLVNHLTENVVRRPTIPLIWTLYRALEETYKMDWRNETDYMTPTCFMYLLERLLILTSCAEGHFFAVKSSLVEFLVCHQGEFDLGPVPMDRLGSCLRFISQAASELLGDPIGLQQWFQRSNLNLKEYFQKFMLKLALLVCIFYLNFGDNSAALFPLLDYKRISGQLPLEFSSILLQFRSGNSRKTKAGILAGELRKISDTLVLVSLQYDCLGLVNPDTIFLDTRVNKTKDDMLKVLFSKSNDDVVRESLNNIAEAQKQSVATEEGVVTKEVEFAENKPEDQVHDDEAPSKKAEKNLEARAKWKNNKSKGSKKKGGM